MNFLPRALLLALSLAVSACGIDVKHAARPWYYPGVGVTVVLHRAVTFQPGAASLFFQHGEPLGDNHDYFEPYCRLIIRDISDKPYRVEPDTFQITRSNRYMDMFAGMPLRLADAGAREQAFVGSDAGPLLIAEADAPSDVIETIQMALWSPRQPNVTRLECGGAKDHPANAVPPTLAEMQAALGEIASFRNLPK